MTGETKVRGHKRAGDGGSPVQVRQQSKITPEPQAEQIYKWFQ